MTKKEQKYIKSLKDENDGLRSLLIRFMDAVGKLTNIDDVVNMSLIPIMTEKTKRFKAEFKAEAYKEFADILINEKLAVILLKNVSDEFAIGYETALIDVEQKANNLLNELVGDGDGKRKD